MNAERERVSRNRFKRAGLKKRWFGPLTAFHFRHGSSPSSDKVYKLI